MRADVERARHRRWADIVVIIASVYALAAATWFPPEMISGGGAREVRFGDWLWTAYAAGGALGLGGVFVALRSATTARVMVAIGGALLLSGFMALHRITPLALASLGITGLALLAAAPFMGAMPTPEEEGKRR